jgi:hypothetical protein
MLDCMPSRLAPSVLASLLLVSSSASADVLWKGDFETNDLSQWDSTLNLTTGQRTNITVVTSTVREGKYAGQLVVHPDDLWPNGHNRVELHHDGKRTNEGETTFFSWCFQLPVNVTVHEDVGYWETNGPDYQQTMAFFVDPKNGATQIGFRTNKPTSKTQWTAPLSVGEWHQIAMEIFWSQNAANGKVTVYLDGAMVVDHVTAQTKPNAATVFTQVGYHRDSSQQSVDAIFIDDAREGTTIDDVLTKAADAGTDASGGAVSDATNAGGSGGEVTGASGAGGNGGSGGAPGTGGSGPSNGGGGSARGSSGASGVSGGAQMGPAVGDSTNGGCACSFSTRPRTISWTVLFALVGASMRGPSARLAKRRRQLLERLTRARRSVGR